MTSARRPTISGRAALLILAGAIVVVSAVIYVFVVRLKMGGTDAIRLRPAPATGSAPSQ
ncbi:MAG: hypothetical protein JNK58_08275 [Phycisphaerae bacterium]|nr:hypothetical protein [Phycisphaerae bacterium]